MRLWQKLFGGAAAATAKPAAAAVARAVEPLRFRVEEASPLRGSPSGTQAWIARTGNGGQESRFRFELSPDASQISEHFGFSVGAFWREPGPASMLPALLNAFGVNAPAGTFKMSKLPVSVESLTAEGAWFDLTVRLQESKALVRVRFSLAEGFGELSLPDGATAQAVADELAQVL